MLKCRNFLLHCVPPWIIVIPHNPWINIPGLNLVGVVPNAWCVKWRHRRRLWFCWLKVQSILQCYQHGNPIFIPQDRLRKKTVAFGGIWMHFLGHFHEESIKMQCFIWKSRWILDDDLVLRDNVIMLANSLFEDTDFVVTCSPKKVPYLSRRWWIFHRARPSCSWHDDAQFDRNTNAILFDFGWFGQLSILSYIQPFQPWRNAASSCLPPWRVFCCEWNWTSLNFKNSGGILLVVTHSNSMDAVHSSSIDASQSSHDVFPLISDLSLLMICI